LLVFVVIQLIKTPYPKKIFARLCGGVEFFSTFPKQSIQINVNLTQNPPKT
jgi:hypothetical protein